MLISFSIILGFARGRMFPWFDQFFRSKGVFEVIYGLSLQFLVRS